jgi:hypothetical protein
MVVFPGCPGIHASPADIGERMLIQVDGWSDHASVMASSARFSKLSFIVYSAAEAQSMRYQPCAHPTSRVDSGSSLKYTQLSGVKHGQQAIPMLALFLSAR